MRHDRLHDRLTPPVHSLLFVVFCPAMGPRSRSRDGGSASPGSIMRFLVACSFDGSLASLCPSTSTNTQRLGAQNCFGFPNSAPDTQAQRTVIFRIQEISVNVFMHLTSQASHKDA
jgi:hypothetical protein